MVVLGKVRETEATDPQADASLFARSALLGVEAPEPGGHSCHSPQTRDAKAPAPSCEEEAQALRGAAAVPRRHSL